MSLRKLICEAFNRLDLRSKRHLGRISLLLDTYNVLLDVCLRDFGVITEILDGFQFSFMLEGFSN